MQQGVCLPFGKQWLQDKHDRERRTPYENALAERMNRTLKDEFGLGEIIKTKEMAYKMEDEAVFLYNNIRPHNSLNYKTPEQAHKKIPDKFLHYQGQN